MRTSRKIVSGAGIELNARNASSCEGCTSYSTVTETGSLVTASGSGSQLPSYAGGAGRTILVVGGQKIVPDLATALRRVEDHCLPLESARTQVVHGCPSAINRLLVLNAEPYPGRSTVLLLREAIGF